MATCPTDITSYIEEIRTFVFRGIDGITIPKVVREQAYVLAVDIVIRSIAKESYVNYECMPPEGFYGNATIVLQDALELKIPVKFPRQRLYYGRVPEAFQQWNELVNFEYQRAHFKSLDETIRGLGTALLVFSFPSVFCCSLPQPSWQELPLREVYFHPPIGTQYELEVTWTRPVAFSDSCNTFYEGLSRQVDGDKDDGLPPNGIFPNIADDSDNPYDNLPPETPDSEQLGFSNSKSANLGDLDPESEARENVPASSSTEGYYLEYGYETLVDGVSGNGQVGIERAPSLSDTILEVETLQSNILGNGSFPDIRFDQKRVKVNGVAINTYFTPVNYLFNGIIKYGILPPGESTNVPDKYY